MTGKLHVLCLTTSRADFGLLRWPMKAIETQGDMRLSLVAGGGHLARSQGDTLSEIEADGFAVAETLPMYLDGGGGAAQALSGALAADGLARSLARLRPDWVLLLGDRYEILGAAAAAAMSRVPICHLCGGDVTEGADDDAYRHAVSKLAALHCVTNAEAAGRLRQMGEEDWRIHNTGSPALDALSETPQIDREEAFGALGLDPDRPAVLVTYHTETRADDLGQAGFEALLQALGAHPDLQILFTGANADAGGDRINARIAEVVAAEPRATFRVSLGHRRFLQTVPHMRAVIGNSSSGLYEVPSLGVPTVNIGRRQEGRLRAASVLDAAADRASIARALAAALAWRPRPVANPYGDGAASERIVAALRQAGADRGRLLRKRFVDLCPEAAA